MCFFPCVLRHHFRGLFGDFLAPFWLPWGHFGPIGGPILVPLGHFCPSWAPNRPQSRPMAPQGLQNDPQDLQNGSILVHFGHFFTSWEVISSLLVLTSCEVLSALLVPLFTSLFFLTACTCGVLCASRYRLAASGSEKRSRVFEVNLDFSHFLV